jgi:actin-like ATPase involved in cell morphogenesis
MSAIGFDVGTFNLICARRGENGSEVKCSREVNAFIELNLEDQNRSFFNVVKGKVPLIERGDKGYIFGQAAIDMALTLPKLELKRPMSDGCLNPREKDAFKILQLMCHSMIGKIANDKEVLYFCVPANAVNAETDANFHRDVLADIFKSYKVDNKTLVPHHINEAMALVYAELGEKQFSGIGISFGAGMVNFCHAIYATEVSSFSIVNAGDWIDNQAAKATGETPVFINKAKTKIDLTATPTNFVERAIKAQYRLMVENTVANIKKAIQNSENKIRSEEPIDVVVAGGTASPNGFVELVKEVIASAKLPIPIGEIRRPNDHLYAVARGCLVAAEASQA